MTVALIPYACGLGAEVPGCERGPEFVLNSGLPARLAREHIPAVWLEGLEPWTNSFVPELGSNSRLTIIKEHCQDVCENVANAVARRMLPVTLGGDHTASIGSLSGLAQGAEAHGRIGMLWLNAHPAAHIINSSPNKALQGMALAIALGYGHADLIAIGGWEPKLQPEHCCVIGTRASDEAEQQLLEKLGVHVIPMEVVREKGLNYAIHRANDILSLTETHALSFDLDVMDPTEIPGVGIPEPDGFTRDQMLQLLQGITNKTEFHAIDISEYNPKFDRNAQTLTFIGDALAVLTQRHANLHGA